MPEISRFHGIVIRMFYNDHAPPHFHVMSAGHRASFLIEGGTIRSGPFPQRARKLVTAWAIVRHDELMENWERARRGDMPTAIAPLR